MSQLSSNEILQLDRQFIWHPYSSLDNTTPLYSVKSAQGSVITLSDDTQLIDGMSSWWCAIHGYNHPTLNQAIEQQLKQVAHIMFGGFTHEPAAKLAQTLVEITPEGLDHVFLADSGSVSVEVAIKMAIQYWVSQGNTEKYKLLSLKNGYHGDTLGAMSLCDPITGMHHLFEKILPQNIFADAPPCDFDETWNDSALTSIKTLLNQHHHQLAAVILEPIVQGAGGMRFYSPEYLKQVRSLCDEYNVLLIADEIATGFGRTGKMFACEHANISPDILCLGKSLTGGYMTLAATLCNSKVAKGICEGEAGIFMHGPTFMGNPLACAVANANIELLLNSPWQALIQGIETQLKKELAACNTLANVKNVRTLGAIGVVELKQPVNMKEIVPKFVDQGIWIRPFGKLVYTMPAFNIKAEQLTIITQGIFNTLHTL